jgi:hypothetical protein
MSVIIFGYLLSYLFSKKTNYYYYRELPFSEGPVSESHFLDEITLDDLNGKSELKEFFVFANPTLKVYQLYWQISATQLPFSKDYLREPKRRETTFYLDKERILIKFIKYLTPSDIKLIELGFFHQEPILISSEMLKNEIVALWHFFYQSRV